MTVMLFGRMFLLPAVALAGATLLPATAGANSAPTSIMRLAIHDEHSGEFRKAMLTCDPAGGSHPDASQACASLEAAHGDFSALQPKKTQCPLIYAPVRATAEGTWHGRQVNFDEEFSNSCVAEAETGGVFKF